LRRSPEIRPCNVPGRLIYPILTGDDTKPVASDEKSSKFDPHQGKRIVEIVCDAPLHIIIIISINGNGSYTSVQ
jgi:hypothetical protein